jgi:hypothetical protein
MDGVLYAKVAKANSKRTINWIFFIVGLILFIPALIYIRGVNSEVNAVTPTNPYGVTYQDAYNSKQRDTIKDVPIATVYRPRSLNLSTIALDAPCLLSENISIGAEVPFNMASLVVTDTSLVNATQSTELYNKTYFCFSGHVY